MYIAIEVKMRNISILDFIILIHKKDHQLPIYELLKNAIWNDIDNRVSTQKCIFLLINSIFVYYLIIIHFEGVGWSNKNIKVGYHLQVDVSNIHVTPCFVFPDHAWMNFTALKIQNEFCRFPIGKINFKSVGLDPLWALPPLSQGRW